MFSVIDKNTRCDDASELSEDESLDHNINDSETSSNLAEVHTANSDVYPPKSSHLLTKMVEYIHSSKRIPSNVDTRH